jgi:L,D-peptidoglycan transpeptidase YkuD (ErfK/YbiS/YcfS/YnhG family)
MSVDPVLTRQVLVVSSSGKKDLFQATVTAWTCAKGVWRKTFGPWPVVIGRNGFAPAGEKREGDGRTPSGVYALRLAFGREPVIKTGLVYRQATADDIWVDDVHSGLYNRWTILPTSAASYENMLRPDGLYDLGAVIEYNTDPVVAGYGSAIFMHIWRDHGRKPTAGCVALERWRLRHLLKWLRSDMNPVIVLKWSQT